LPPVQERPQLASATGPAPSRTSPPAAGARIARPPFRGRWSAI
jgi:hypothetical protein